MPGCLQAKQRLVSEKRAKIAATVAAARAAMMQPAITSKAAGKEAAGELAEKVIAQGEGTKAGVAQEDGKKNAALIDSSATLIADNSIAVTSSVFLTCNQAANSPIPAATHMRKRCAFSWLHGS